MKRETDTLTVGMLYVSLLGRFEGNSLRKGFAGDFARFGIAAETRVGVM